MIMFIGKVSVLEPSDMQFRLMIDL